MPTTRNPEQTLANLQRQIVVLEERLRALDAEWNLHDRLLQSDTQRLRDLRLHYAGQRAALAQAGDHLSASARAELAAQITGLERASTASEVQVAWRVEQTEQRQRILERGFEAARRKLTVLQRALAAVQENQEALP